MRRVTCLCVIVALLGCGGAPPPVENSSSGEGQASPEAEASSPAVSTLLTIGAARWQFVNELSVDHMVELGWLAARPPPDYVFTDYHLAMADPDAGFDTLEPAARSYLHANCSHCHRVDGPADQSNLFLNIENTDLLHLGRCKITVAGGCGAGSAVFVPGDGSPDASVMVCRMASDRPGDRMPELPNVLVHVEGVDLIRRWIGAMDPVDCSLFRP